MFETDTPKSKLFSKAFLVGIQEFEISPEKAQENLNELKELVNTMGLQVTNTETVKLKEKNSKYYIGSGKVEEISVKAREGGAQCIIVDFELSPAQQRNWEKTTGFCVIDRQEVILEIFANRASTKEAVIQVSLARMEYSLPRLKRAWTHLSRQKGGTTGMRGEGEKQIETDRRLITDKIAQLKRKLAEVKKQRNIERSKREELPMPVAAIVGYTNVGKTSILNYFSPSSNALVENKLFATLDPTTRLVKLKNNQELLLTDTVGLIRKLPHNLVEAFKSTLEEAVIADFIIHVLDVSSPSIEEHSKTTIKLLKELDAFDKPIITVYNKSDKLQDSVTKARMRANRPDAVFISAKEGDGIDNLKEKLVKQLNKETELVKLKIPAGNYEVPARAYQTGKVLSIDYQYDFTYITARINPRDLHFFKQYIYNN